MPSITIDGAPETITREQYLALVRASGFEPERIYSLTLHHDHIEAVVFAEPRIVRRDNSLAKHTVIVKVVDA